LQVNGQVFAARCDVNPQVTGKLPGNPVPEPNSSTHDRLIDAQFSGCVPGSFCTGKAHQSELLGHYNL
jgi:hypothetical protein